MRRFFTRHWVWLHVAVAVAVPGFLGLGWWQVVRAGAGNARSYGYAIEWPSFAVIVIVLYVRAIRMELHGPHPDAATANSPGPTPVHVAVGAPPPPTDEDDPELAAYNRFLGDLHERDLQQRS